jgi:hypothetical protein
LPNFGKTGLDHLQTFLYVSFLAAKFLCVFELPEISNIALSKHRRG